MIMKEDSEYEDDGTVSNEIIKCVSENCQNATTGEKEKKRYIITNKFTL